MPSDVAVDAILKKPEVVEKLAKQGLVPVGGAVEQFAQFIAGEIAKWQDGCERGRHTMD